MIAREVPEWRGKTPDTPAPARVRLRVFEAHGGRCYLTGRKIMPGDVWELDHKVALINGGLNVESNLAPALKAAHREKTNADVAEKAKVARVRMKHLGIFPKSKRPLRSRGFSPSRDVMGEGK
jgi:5-methylcytosine-specific restriction endonuclease McrA